MAVPTPLPEAATTTGAEATAAKSIDTPVPSSTPTIPELWTDDLSDLSSLSEAGTSEDESESEEEPLVRLQFSKSK